MNNQSQIRGIVIPDTWYGRAIAALVAACLVVVGLFFVAFALAAAAIVAAIVAVRIWWLRKKLRARRDQTVIEGSYSVETDHEQVTLPPRQP